MQVKRSITVNQPIEKVWKIIAIDFGKIGDIITAVNSSTLDNSIEPAIEGAVAAGRVCQTNSMGEIREIITSYDENNKILGYEADVSGLPKFVRGLENNWSLHSRDRHTTEIKMLIKGNLVGIGFLMTPIMEFWLSRMGKKILEEVKYYAETGKVHPDKIKAFQTVDLSPRLK